jgi:beta-lactamase class A
MRLMIIASSNLATNLLIERVGPARVMGLMREIGARNIHVLRGVEDGKAYERGLNNTTTARDLMIIARRIAAGRAVSKAASDEMINVLLDQQFNEGIPAGLPQAARVAHKTGSITGINHDAAIVFPPRRKAYVLVVLTRGLGDETRAHKLIADISRAIYETVEGKESGAKSGAATKARLPRRVTPRPLLLARHCVCQISRRRPVNRTGLWRVESSMLECARRGQTNQRIARVCA